MILNLWAGLFALTGLSFLVGVMPSTGSYGQSRGTELVPEDPVGAMLKAFDTHDIVGFGESHASENEHRVIQALLRDPRFPTKVNDVIVEFGNSRYQSVIDRYVAGEEISQDTLRMVWRNALFFMVWDRPIYEQVFRTVREINRTLPPDRRVRVLLAEEPFDWAEIRSVEMFDSLDLRRDGYYADLIEREVLSRGRKALAIFGMLHFLRAPYWSGNSVTRDSKKAGLVTARQIRLGQLIETRHPGALYFIWSSSLSTGDRNTERALASLSVPSLVPLRGTWLGQQDFRQFLRFEAADSDPASWRKQTFQDVADACLYVGPGKDQLQSEPSPSSYRDTAWVSEMISRAARLGELGRYYRLGIDAARAKYAGSPSPQRR